MADMSGFFLIDLTRRTRAGKYSQHSLNSVVHFQFLKRIQVLIDYFPIRITCQERAWEILLHCYSTNLLWRKEIAVLLMLTPCSRLTINGNSWVRSKGFPVMHSKHYIVNLTRSTIQLFLKRLMASRIQTNSLSG